MTKTEIANIALRRARESRISGDIDSSTNFNAELIRDIWSQVAKLVLQATQPSFAQKQATLTQLTATPEFEWDYAYQLPTDYVDVVRFNGLNAGEVQDAYDILSNRQLVTDEETVSLTYIFNEEGCGNWTPDFIEAFSLKMAFEIVNENRGSQDLIQNLMTLYGQAVSQSRGLTGKNRKDPTTRERVLRSSQWTRGNRVISTNETSY